MKDLDKNTAVRDFKILWYVFFVLVALDNFIGIPFALRTMYSLTPMVIMFGVLVLIQSQKLFYLALKPKVKLKKKTRRRKTK